MGSDVSLSKAVRSNLLSLQNTATMMDKTQSRLATGNKVNSALDNPSNFFTASALNSRAADMSNLLDSMANGIKTIEAASNGITAITKNVESMQSTLRQARQDKSFQTSTFEVNAASTLAISGGQFDELTNIKLGTQSAGVSATVSSAATYAGPSIETAKGEGFGARQIVTLDGAGATDVMKIAGKQVTIDSTSVATSVTAINSAISSDPALVGKYKASVGTGVNANKLVIETVDPFGEAASIEYGTGITAATKGTTTIKYDPAIVGAVTAGNGNQSITTGGSFDEFVAGLQAKAKDGKYTVSADATTKQIVLTNTEYGNSSPAVGGITPISAVAGVKASNTFDLAVTSAQVLTVDGQNVNIANAATDADVIAAIQGNATLAAKYDVTSPSAGKFALTAKATGVATAPVISTTGGAKATAAITLSTTAAQNISIAGVTGTIALGAGDTDAAVMTKLQANTEFAAAYTITNTGAGAYTITARANNTAAPGITSSVPAQLTGTPAGTPGTTLISNATPVTGVTAVAAVGEVTSVAGSNGGAHFETVAAATDDIKVTYDGKTAEIGIKGMVKAGTLPTAAETAEFQANTIKSVNDQLKAKGLDTLEATFVDGKLSISSKGTEAKTLAISGTDATSIFGADSVNTGKASVSGYSSTNAVDMFVEEINRNSATAGKLRASNDNGKLRIENLSTQKLDVSFDKDGAGVGSPVSSTVAGNTVRDNLSKQFNELRDQLDKLSDDSSFNGINLLRGDKLTITFNESGSSSIKIQAKDKDGNERSISAANLDIASLVGEDLDTDEGIDALLGKLSTALTELRSQASTFGSNLSSVENRQSFTKNMINTLETGAATLTLADTNEEAANLLALQTRQQLSSSALSMASQQDQAVLQLLR